MIFLSQSKFLSRTHGERRVTWHPFAPPVDNRFRMMQPFAASAASALKPRSRILRKDSLTRLKDNLTRCRGSLFLRKDNPIQCKGNLFLRKDSSPSHKCNQAFPGCNFTSGSKNKCCRQSGDLVPHGSSVESSC